MLAVDFEVDDTWSKPDEGFKDRYSAGSQDWLRKTRTQAHQGHQPNWRGRTLGIHSTANILASVAQDAGALIHDCATTAAGSAASAAANSYMRNRNEERKSGSTGLLNSLPPNSRSPSSPHICTPQAFLEPHTLHGITFPLSVVAADKLYSCGRNPASDAVYWDIKFCEKGKIVLSICLETFSLDFYLF